MRLRHALRFSLALLFPAGVLAGCSTPSPALPQAKTGMEKSACPETLLSQLYKIQCDASPTTGQARNIIFY